MNAFLALLWLSKAATAQSANADVEVSQRLAAAQQAEQSHNYADAGREYQDILRRQPKNALIHQSLAVTYHLQNLFPEAITEFKRALALDPNLFGSYLFLGMDYYKSNQFKLAVAPLKKSIDLNPQMAEPEARFWLAATYSALGHAEEAVHELRRDLVLRPRDSDVLYYLVKAYDQSSSAAFERLGRVDPKCAAVALLQGERFAEENRTDVAELQYRTAVALRPDFASWIPPAEEKKLQSQAPPAGLAITAFDAQANLDLAGLFDSAGDSARAAAVRESLRRLKGADPKAAQLVTQAAIEPSHPQPAGSGTDLAQGLTLFREGQFKHAQDFLSRAIARNRNPALQALLIRSYLEAGDVCLAEDGLKKILHSDSSNIDALHLLGRNYKKQAELTLNLMMGIDPDFYGVHELLGKQHEEHTEYAQAISEYQAALAKRPDLAGIRYDIGNVYRKMSKYDEAEHWLNAELERNPYHGLAQFRLGSIYLEQGKLDESISHLEQALRAHPELIDAQLDLGRAYSAKGRYPEAVSELRHVAAAQPDNDRVHYLLAGAYAKQGDRSHAQAELAEYQRLTRSRLQNTQQDVKNLSDSLNHP